MRLFPFDGFWGMRGENSCNVFLLLFMVLWVLTFPTLCKRAVLMLWHAFLFLGLRPVGFFLLLSFCLAVSTSFYLAAINLNLLVDFATFFAIVFLFNLNVEIYVL
jgi:hypothetical protein